MEGMRVAGGPTLLFDRNSYAAGVAEAVVRQGPALVSETPGDAS